MSDLPRLAPDAAGSAAPCGALADDLARRLDDATIFEWLAGLFAAAPAPEAVADLRRGAAAAAIDRLAADPRLAPALRALSAAIAAGGSDEAAAHRLSRAWGRLFLGLGGPETVPPYESAFHGDGRLFQAPTAEMDRLLADHDLAVGAEVREPADHLAIELALAAHLTAADHPDRRRLVGRLAAWVPRFRDALGARDETGLWSAAADLLVVVLDRATETETAHHGANDLRRGRDQ